MHASLSGAWTEPHINRHYTDGEYFVERVAHGSFTFVLAADFGYRSDIVERTGPPLLWMNSRPIPAPVHVGNTMSMAMAVAETKDLSIPDVVALVLIGTAVTNPDGETEFEGNLKVLIETKVRPPGRTWRSPADRRLPPGRRHRSR